MDRSDRLMRANTTTVTEDPVQSIHNLSPERERPSSSPVPRSNTRFVADLTDFVRTKLDFEQDEDDDDDEEENESEDEEDEEDDDDDDDEDDEEEEEEIISNPEQTNAGEQKKEALKNVDTVAVVNASTANGSIQSVALKPSTQPSASSTASSTASQKSSALPPLTSDHLNAVGRFTNGTASFFDSFFGTDELDRYFPNHKLRLSILTWNMSSKPPDNYTQELAEMLMPNSSTAPVDRSSSAAGLAADTDSDTLSEVYVIGLQETPKSEMVLTNLKVGIQAVLGPNYALLQWSCTGVLHASVWLRRELLWSCTSVDTVSIHSRPTPANRIKTKGAVALSFCLFGTSFLFINTHLSAHEGNLRTRINQLDKVQQTLNLKAKPSKSAKGKRNSSKTKGRPSAEKTEADSPNGRFGRRTSVKTTTTTTNRGSQKRGSSRRNRLKHSEYIFWFGDLNFRLELPHDTVLQAVRDISNANNEEQRLQRRRKLMCADQLTNLMDRGMVFEGYHEAIWPPPFMPTYKWKPKSRGDKQSDKSSTTTTTTTTTTTNHHTRTISNSESASSSPTPSLMSSVSSIHSTNSSSGGHTVSHSVPHNLDRLASSRLELTTNADSTDSLVLEYNLHRVPSFTDRILFQTRLDTGDSNECSQSGTADSAVRCVHYSSVSVVTSSDHKPVYGQFEVRLHSGGPRIPLRLRKLKSRMVDSFKSRINLTRENSFDGQTANTPTRNLSFFGRKLGGGRKRGKVKINDDQQNGGPTVQSSVSMSALPTSFSLVQLDKLTRLNAGAFERQIFIDGLRLRNTFLAQNYARQPMDGQDRPQPHNNTFGGLFKSRSFDSNVVTDAAVVAVNGHSTTNVGDTPTVANSTVVTHSNGVVRTADKSWLSSASSTNGSSRHNHTHHKHDPKQSSSSICLVM